jgi:hypothetical protein
MSHSFYKLVFFDLQKITSGQLEEMGMKVKAKYRIAIATFAVGLLSLLQTGKAVPQSSGSGAQYKILSDRRMALTLPYGKTGIIDHFLLEDITPCRAQDYVKPTYACTIDELYGSTTPDAKYEFNTSTSGSNSGALPPIDQVAIQQQVIFNLPSNQLKGSRVYRLTYWQPPNPGSVTPNVTVVAIDTTPAVSIAEEVEQKGQNQLHLSSSLAFTSNGMILTSNQSNCPTPGSKKATDAAIWLPVELQADKAAKGQGPSGIDGVIHRLDQSLNPDAVGPDGHAPGLKQALSQIGIVDVCIDARNLKSTFSVDSSQAGAMLSGVLHVKSPLNLSANSGHCTLQGDISNCGFQLYASSDPTIWTFAQGAKLSSNSIQPTGKSDAGFYANVNMVAATGAKFAWGLDGKVAELQRQIGHTSWLLTPLSATANTGNNTSSIKSQTYSDSIDWTLPFSYEWDRIGKHVTTLVFVAAPDFSTDIEFDRKNMLADMHFQLTPPSWYQVLQKRNTPVSGAPWKYPNTSKVHFGAELQLQAGIEAGRAIIDTTQKASSGTAKITVPVYDIARAVPQIHGLFQWLPTESTKLGLLTMDETITGRLLMATENTVDQYAIPAVGTAAATVGLKLVPLTGWKGYNSLVSTWYPPFSSNVGFTATYNDGFNAPKFARINSVTIGVTIMY